MLQLTLPLQLRADATFANFYAGPNQLLVTCLQQLTKAQAEKFLYLQGKPSSGRSHLLQAVCHLAYQQALTASYLSLAQYQQLDPSILDNLEDMDIVCLDDFECIAGINAWEQALFNLYHRISETPTRLLIAARKNPIQLQLQLPDLTSRLQAMLQFSLHDLTDPDKIIVLQLHASQRGLQLPTAVAEFLLRRCSRDLRDLIELLTVLDQSSLREQRRLTIPFVKKIVSY